MARSNSYRSRRLSGVGATTALMLALADCSTGDTSGSDCDSNGNGENAGTAGGDLVLGITSDPDTLFPWKATQFQSVHFVENIYDTLTELDEDLEVVPGLAEDWDVSEDGLTVTFHLRDDVTFHDGSTLDADDVKFSFEAIMDEDTAAVSAASLASVESVEAEDEHTVVLNLESPDAALPANIAVVGTSILSADDTEEELNTAPNGTGAFKFETRDANQSLTLVKNDDYWGDEPLLDSVEFRIIPEETSIVAAIQSGNIHMEVFDDPLVADTAASDSVTVEETPLLSYHALQFNARQEPLDDVNVRLAIQCAIDRDEVLDTAALGEGEVTGPITSPAYESDPDARPCPTKDVDKAKEYLEEAGYSDGLQLDVMVSQGEYATSVDEAQNVKSQLADVGIDVDIEVLEIGTYVDRWIDADFTAAIALNGGNPDPDGMYGRYFTSNGNLNEVAGYESDELDALFKEGKQTADPEDRKPIYDEISRELEDNAVWVWLFTGYTYTAMNEAVEGFVPKANESLLSLRSTSLTH